MPAGAQSTPLSSRPRLRTASIYSSPDQRRRSSMTRTSVTWGDLDETQPSSPEFQSPLRRLSDAEKRRSSSVKQQPPPFLRQSSIKKEPRTPDGVLGRENDLIVENEFADRAKEAEGQERDPSEKPGSGLTDDDEDVGKTSTDERTLLGKSKTEREMSGRKTVERIASGKRRERSSSGELDSVLTKPPNLLPSPGSALSPRRTKMSGSTRAQSLVPLQLLVASDSRSSLHFISTDEDDDDKVLSDSSFQYDLPHKAETGSSKTWATTIDGVEKKTLQKRGNVCLFFSVTFMGENCFEHKEINLL